VAHGHVRVNGRRLDRAPYLVEAGDIISLASRARELPVVVVAAARGPEVKLPGFVALDADEPFTGRVLGAPARSDVPFIVEDAAVAEFYAR
jgi:small subunit ribosomal protein S4